jgi:hypothetical protein
VEWNGTPVPDEAGARLFVGHGRGNGNLGHRMLAFILNDRATMPPAACSVQPSRPVGKFLTVVRD